MTSANLSLADRVRNHKKYISRTLWTSVIAGIFMAIYYILGVIMMVSRSINYARFNGQSLQTLQYEKYNAVTKVMGFEQLGFILIIFTAIAFAFQGFSYVFEQKKIDFFLSQPTTRSERIRKNYFNALSTFGLILLTSELLALLAAFVMGAVNSVVLVTVLIEMVRSYILFFTFYSLTVVAILLCGSMPMALMTLIFLLAVTAVIGMELTHFKSIFFATYSSYSDTRVYASPVYDRLDVFSKLREMSRYSDHNMSFDAVRTALKSILPYELDLIVEGIVSAILVSVLSRYRRAEHAGKTICFKPVRYIIKTVSCILVGLVAGSILVEIYSTTFTNGTYVLMFVIMILATVLTGCIIEAILEGGINKFFGGMGQTIMAACVVSLVFLIFIGDLLGYDSYVPKASAVESCAFCDDDYSFQLYHNNYNEYEVSSRDNMILECTDDFLKLAKAGMAEQKREIKEMQKGNYNFQSYDIDILYRLKNGRKVYRTISIPYGENTDILAEIVNSDGYKKGFFKVFHDDSMRENDKMSKSSSVRYSSGTDELVTTKLPYAELSDAYRKDIEAFYSFEMVENTAPIGRIEYSSDGSADYARCEMNVYPGFVNTIELLKKYEIYSESEYDVQNIESVVVTNYYSGYNGMNGAIPEDVDKYETVTVTYTDEDKIREILDNSRSGSFYSRWYNSYKYDDQQYSIEIIMRGNAYQAYNVFEMGKVPDFVVSDTN